MLLLLRWWLLAELLGVLALPLCATLFRRLPDRGYGFTKIIGLLVVAYVAWIGGTLGILPFSPGALLLAMLGLAIAAALLVRGRLGAMLAELRAQKRYIIWAEVVFALTLATVGVLRSYAPEIANTEKPFEFASFNAVNRTQFFAPTDPWMSGQPDAYYYVGYEVVDSAAKLTGTEPAYAFNLSLILIAGLTAFTAFGLAVNVAALLGGRTVSATWPLVAGAGGIVLLMVIGNLEGVLESGAAHGWDPQWVYQHLGITGAGALLARPSAHWYPDESGFGSWWRATRLGSDWNFLEFPFFSFLLGDLHPHVLSLPFKFLAGGFALAAGTVESLPRPGAWRQGWFLLIGAALSLTALVTVHPWDFPPFALLMCAVLGWRYLRGGPERFGSARSAAVVAGAVVLGAVLLGAPYVLGGGRGAISGIAATQPFHIAQATGNAVNAEASYLPFQHFLLFWTPLMLPASLFVIWALHRRSGRALRQYGPTCLAVVALAWLAWLFVVLVSTHLSGLEDELRVRGWGWLTVLVLGLLLAASLAALIGESDGGEPVGSDLAVVFLLAATCVAVLLVYGPELFMVKDSSGTRANSTFKLWYDSWALLSVVGAVGGGWALWQRVPNPRGLARMRRLAIPACALVLAGSLLYTADAWASRAAQATGPRTLDGLAWLQRSDPDEYNAAAWLNANVPGVVNVLQAVGPSYDTAARISSRTGLPTVLDWPFHEQQMRGQNYAQIPQRTQDVQTIYTTADPVTAFQLLFRYNVQYVVVGSDERRIYGEAGLSKFASMGTPVFTTLSVVIYRVGRAPLFGGAP